LHYKKPFKNSYKETGQKGMVMKAQLVESVKAGDVAEVARMLLAGADVNSRDEEGATLLMLAAYASNLAMVEALIEAGADVNAQDARGWSAISRAVYNAEQNRGFAEVVQVLINAGANIEAAISYGVRPLMLAAGYGETAVVEVLLNAGADVLAKNEGGFTALMMVKQKHYVDVVNLLHEAEQISGLGEGSCESKNAPGSNVITFLKRT
jgi:ankyrin repeat protein